MSKSSLRHFDGRADLDEMSTECKHRSKDRTRRPNDFRSTADLLSKTPISSTLHIADLCQEVAVSADSPSKKPRVPIHEIVGNAPEMITRNYTKI